MCISKLTFPFPSLFHATEFSNHDRATTSAAGVVGCSKENFDSYFTKLQNICTDSMNEDVKSGVVADTAKGIHSQQQGKLQLGNVLLVVTCAAKHAGQWIMLTIWSWKYSNFCKL